MTLRAYLTEHYGICSDWPCRCRVMASRQKGPEPGPHCAEWSSMGWRDWSDWCVKPHPYDGHKPPALAPEGQRQNISEKEEPCGGKG
jgi:hypothetical protein